MSNIDLVKSFIEKNNKLSDEEVSVRLGVSIKKVKKARDLLKPKEDTRSKLFSVDSRPDAVDNPKASLEAKIREIEQAFEIARKEFMFDPNADNAQNMNSFLASIKTTLKELDSFNDLTEIAERIINEVLATLTKELMIASYKTGEKIVEEYREYFPKALKYKVDDFRQEFKDAIGKKTKNIYDNAIDNLENILKVNLGYFRNSERTEPIYKKDKKKNR